MPLGLCPNRSQNRPTPAIAASVPPCLDGLTPDVQASRNAKRASPPTPLAGAAISRRARTKLATIRV